jgi:hypothetical protein
MDRNVPKLLLYLFISAVGVRGFGCPRMRQIESQNSIYLENKKVAEEIAESISPISGCVSPCCWSIKSLFVVQGDVSEGSAPSGTAETTATFTDAIPGDLQFAESSHNPIAEGDGTSDLGLATFLARPTVIDTFAWSTSDNVGVKQTIQPWHLFMNNATIIRKLNNYGFIRGKLHIKVIINATPFQYGLMRVCSLPLLGTVDAKIRTNTTSDSPLRLPYSQTPGIYLEPQKNAGGELELPFFYYKNWLDITSAADVQNMGSLTYVVFSVLSRALSSAPSSITIRTLAWMTDVELMASTSKLALQGDEYGSGPVSGIATAIANSASFLTKIPIIGKFARATQIGASSVSRIASIFGFTNVPNIENVRPFYNMSAPHLATAEISVPYQKLVLDPKTELSIDPTPFGLSNEDELTWASIKRRESFFGTAVMVTTDAVNTKIFNCRVVPTLNSNVALVNTVPAIVGYRTYDTPLSYFARLCKHWRGGLKFRFKAVLSKYHKGRVKITYDPLNNISALNTETNEVYTHIWDLSETDELTITVPYHQALGWSTLTHSQDDDWNEGTALTPLPGSANGLLSMSIFNVLETPETPSSVYFMVYVSGDDDLEFANPQGWIDNGGTSYQPSFFALQGDESTPQSVTFGTTSNVSADRYGMNYGESVLSFRKLLHRSQFVDTWPLPTGTGSATNIYRKGYLRMPYTPGFVPVTVGTTASKVVAASGTAQYAFNTMHMIPYISGPFLGYRGSVNYTVTVVNPVQTVDDVRVSRCTDAGGVTNTNRLGVLTASTTIASSIATRWSRANSFYHLRNGLAGMAITSTRTAPSVQFTLPDTNNRNFCFVSPSIYVDGDSVDGSDQIGALLTVNITNSTATDVAAYTTVTSAAGAGADFTCLYFLCTPTLDFLLGDPTPV